MERGINDLIAAEAAIGTGERDVAHFAAPAFDQGDGEGIGGGRREIAAKGVVGRGGELLAEVVGGPFDLEGADTGAGEDVAAGPDRDGSLGEAMPTGGMIVTDIADEAAGAGSEADEADLGCLRGCDDADVLKAGTNGGRVPEPCDGLLNIGDGGFEAIEDLSGAGGFEIVTAGAGADEAAAEAIAANQGGEIEEIAADFSAGG